MALDIKIDYQLLNYAINSVAVAKDSKKDFVKLSELTVGWCSGDKYYYVPVSKDRVIVFKDDVDFMNSPKSSNGILFELLGTTKEKILSHLNIEPMIPGGSWPYLSREDMVIFNKFLYSLMAKHFMPAEYVVSEGEIWL